MYDNRRLRFFPTQPEIDIYQIIREAQTRWLRPVEVIEILRNYQKFRLNPVPPNKPPSGSLFLFDRKTLRFFRKDGHNWRKKKDGKTVREAHERLKAGSVDVLHCYYAHGEDNANFQRRSYWMLEGAYEHIVLVHYREVTEGSRSSVYRSIQESNANKEVATQSASASRPGLPFSVGTENEVTGPYKSPELSTTPLESEASEDDQDDASASRSAGETQETSLLQQVSGTPNPVVSNFTFAQAEQKNPPFGSDVKDLSNVDFDDLLRNPDAYLSPKPISPGVTLDVTGWSALLESFRGSPVKVEQTTAMTAYRTPLETRAYQNTMVQASKHLESHHMDVDDGHLQENAASSPSSKCEKQGKVSFEEQRAQSTGASCCAASLPESARNEGGSLKKLDSFGRWMSREIGEDSQSSLLSGSSDHNAYWTLEDRGTLDEISSFSHQMHMEVTVSPSVSHDQQFSIADFSPDWAFASEETKVIVAGNFLKTSPDVVWYCMFGEVEVPAEIVHDGVLRCKAPPHAPGRVPFYVTRGNRLACSEIRDFEYRSSTTPLEALRDQDEQLQMRFAKLVSLTGDDKVVAEAEAVADGAQYPKILALTADWAQQWEDVEKLASPKERVLESLLKQQLRRWLLVKVADSGKGPCVLDSHGQGVLHLAAALGYDWAIPPILASGTGINYRDSHGWTALHWAASRGRENVVSCLLASGASPGLVTDPTPQYPAGRTPADLAASSGHKGMAGYLAEMSLTSHLTSLTLKEKRSATEMDSISAVLAEDKAVELISAEGDDAKGAGDHVLLQDSLRAVRNAARAAALIHASFRQESFKRRQEKEGEAVDEYGMSLREVKALSSLHHGQRKDSLNLAATKIQQKYRGWKGRKDFLLLRQRVVRIQAHVRGHQVRRKFRKLLWTVGILDKAVLRWRRRGAGLRNFRPPQQQDSNNSDEDDEVLRAGRKQKEAAVQQAVTRVQSMVRSHQAREQYQRIQDAVKHAVAGGSNSSEGNHENDADSSMTTAGE